MPQTNGLDLTKRVLEIDEEIKILLMSAFEIEQKQINEVNVGDYLKPIHMNQLIDAARKEVYSTVTH